MQIGDLFWAAIWLVAGLLTFRYTFLKGFLDTIGIGVMIVSAIAIAAKPDELIDFISKYPISYISGTITHLVYLIGANIGRVVHFDTEPNWGRVIVYAICIGGLLLLIHLFPLVSTS